MEFKTYKDMLNFCESHRGESRFCNCNSSCSGPSYSNLACDYPFPDGCEVFRGGCGNRFVVGKGDE